MPLDRRSSNNCSKFSPNIFNPSKCSQCFSTRDEHLYLVNSSSGAGSITGKSPTSSISDQSLELKSPTTSTSLLSSRQLQFECGSSKSDNESSMERMGWLFIAPIGWSPSLHTKPEYRTKRWQRRWFTLYTNSSLTYSLDPDSESLPQGTFDLTKSKLICGPIYNLVEFESEFCSVFGIEVVDKDVVYLRGCSETESRIWTRIIGKYTTGSSEDTVDGAGSSSRSRMLRGDPDGCGASSSSSNTDRRAPSATPTTSTTCKEPITKSMQPSLVANKPPSQVDSGIVELKSATSELLSSALKSSSVELRKSTTSLAREPIRGRQVQDEPILSRQVQEEPMRKKQVQNEDKVSEPINRREVAQEPMRGRQVEPIRARQVLQEPVSRREVLQEPMRARPVQQEPMRGRQALQEPIRRAQSITEPIVLRRQSSQEPTSSSKRHSEPIREAQVLHEPIRERQVILSSTKERIINQEPSKTNSNEPTTITPIPSPRQPKPKSSTYTKSLDLELYEPIAQEKSSSPVENESESRVVNTEVPYQSITTQLTLNPHLLIQENSLLTTRLNDLTEKLYTSEKNLRLTRGRLSRLKNNSLKEKELSGDIYNKIAELELRLGLSSSGSNTDDHKCSPMSGVPAAEWYRCTNCTRLESELNEIKSKLNGAEVEISNLKLVESGLRTELDNASSEMETIKSSTTKLLSLSETSYSTLISNNNSKHELALVDLEIRHEYELAEETRATLSAIEALKRNHELELNHEVNKFKKEWSEKAGDFQKRNTELETRTKELITELTQLNYKYLAKCGELNELRRKLN